MIKRSKLRHFLNTGTSESPAYNLMNLGIQNLTINKNPEYIEEGYIADEVGTKMLESLKPDFQFDINVDETDPVSVYLTEIEWEDKVMEDTFTDIISVQAWKTPVEGAYPAKKYFVSIGVETIGDEALKTMKHSVNAGVRGDAVFGTFNPTTKTFTPSPQSVFWVNGSPQYKGATVPERKHNDCFKFESEKIEHQDLFRW